jgi:glycosyltransferase involved in cell wall biosynthesis
MTKPKVIFITERYWPARGGIEEGLRQLLSLIRDKYSVSVLTMQKTAKAAGLFSSVVGLQRFEAYRDPAGVPVSPLLPGFLARVIQIPIMLRHLPGMRAIAPRWLHDKLFVFFRLAYQRAMRKALEGNGLVVCFSGSYLGMLAGRIGKKNGIPVIFFPSLHPGMWNDSPAAIRSYQDASAVVISLNYTKQYLLGLGNLSGIVTVIPLPIEEDTGANGAVFRINYNLNGPAVLFIGRRVPYKGLPLLIAAFNSLTLKYPEARLVIIGPSDGSFKTVDRPWIQDLGEASTEVKHAALAGCDLLCVPSRSESLGLVYLEAWAHKKPVVACRTAETMELITNEQDGLLVLPDETELSNALERLIAHPELRAALAEQGYKKYRDQYSRASVRGKTEELFKKCIPKATPKRPENKN